MDSCRSGEIDKAGYWIEYAPTLKEAVDRVLNDVQTSTPRALYYESGQIVTIGAR